MQSNFSLFGPTELNVHSVCLKGDFKNFLHGNEILCRTSLTLNYVFNLSKISTLDTELFVRIISIMNMEAYISAFSNYR